MSNHNLGDIHFIMRMNDLLRSHKKKKKKKKHTKLEKKGKKGRNRNR